MTVKTLPCSEERLRALANTHGTPFHLYSESGIRAGARSLVKAFAGLPNFKEHFAVKATPNPFILQIMREEGLGADCSSLPELALAEAVGLRGEDIVFTSNDTPAVEYRKARALGAVINLDDLTHLEFLEREAGMPDLISFRYNPGSLRQGNDIIGKPEEAKYGVTKEQLKQGLVRARELGVKRFGIHTMVISNELNSGYFVETARMMFELAAELYRELDIRIQIINLGGGIGIPYHPDEQAPDLTFIGQEVARLYEEIIVHAKLAPLQVALECGRLMTGPHGWLVARVLHTKNTYKKYIGLDACMADLMRPALYGAYHHITPLFKNALPCDMVYDVTGSLCENNDKFAVDRRLPELCPGDLVVIHDTGAHGHAMGFNYNGKLRSQELLLGEDGSVRRIRRAETMADLFATLNYPGLAMSDSTVDPLKRRPSKGQKSDVAAQLKWY